MLIWFVIIYWVISVGIGLWAALRVKNTADFAAAGQDSFCSGSGHSPSSPDGNSDGSRPIGSVRDRACSGTSDGHCSACLLDVWQWSGVRHAAVRTSDGIRTGLPGSPLCDGGHSSSADQRRSCAADGFDLSPRLPANNSSPARDCPSSIRP